MEPMRVKVGGATMWTRLCSLAVVALVGRRGRQCAAARFHFQLGKPGRGGTWVTVTVVATSRQEGEGRMVLRRGRAGRTDHMSEVCGGVHQWKPSLGARPTTPVSGTSGPPSDTGFESQDEDNHSPPSPSPPWQWPCTPGKDQITFSKCKNCQHLSFLIKRIPQWPLAENYHLF